MEENENKNTTEQNPVSAYGSPMTSVDSAPSTTVPELEADVIAALKTCYDPEIPVDIYELGLIYGIDIAEDKTVKLRMTLTSPACPVAGTLPGDVETKVAAVPGVTSAKVELVWDPPWDRERMSEAAKLQLNMY